MTNKDTDVLNANLLIIHSAFPHVGKAIDLFWGEKEFPPYINNLLSADTNARGARKGFPSEVVSALINLQKLHDELFPQHITDDPDDWMSSQFGVL